MLCLFLFLFVRLCAFCLRGENKVEYYQSLLIVLSQLVPRIAPIARQPAYATDLEHVWMDTERRVLAHNVQVSSAFGSAALRILTLVY